MKKILLLSALFGLNILAFAQKDDMDFYSVSITASRTVKTTKNITQKIRCTTQTDKAEDTYTWTVNLHSEKMLGRLYPNGVMQMRSDLDEEHRKLIHPLTGGGSVTNQGNEQRTDQCTCEECRTCRTTYVQTRNFSGGGALLLPKAHFSFEYDQEEKKGYFNLSLNFENKGSFSDQTKTCSDDHRTNQDEIYVLLLQQKELAYAQPTIKNYEDASTELLDELGMGGIATFSVDKQGNYFANYSHTKIIDHPLNPTLIDSDGNTEITGTDQMTVTTTINVRITGNVPKAIIEPVAGMDAYKKWLPQGPDVRANAKVGNSVEFKVKLVDKTDATKDLSSQIKEVKWSLEEVSKEPGWAMNFPAKNQSKHSDLQFKDLTATNQTDELEKLTTTPMKTATVLCFDYGAFGKIKATVTLANGRKVEAMFEETEKYYANIPWRDDNSFIATYWKVQNQATSLADNDDSEKGEDGVGNHGHDGDGLALYEEYRGFIENQKHIRTDAEKRDLMICDLIGGRSKAGITMLANVTGLKVHHQFKEAEFGREIADEPAEKSVSHLGKLPAFTHDKVLNFNYERAPHLVYQHGIVMVYTPLDLSFVVAVAKEGKEIGTPKNYKYLLIAAGFDPSPNGYSVTMGTMNEDGTISPDPEGKVKIVTDSYARTIAHEILHACNVLHHGDVDYGRVHLRAGKDVEGGVENAVYIIGAGVKQRVNLYWNDAAATPILATDPMLANGLHIYLACKQGEHSGVEDCIMRYDAANAFMDGTKAYNGGNVYLLKKPQGYDYSELSGISLCNASIGTGVNGANATPRKRYGNATPGRGNCKNQFCINDKYH